VFLLELASIRLDAFTIIFGPTSHHELQAQYHEIQSPYHSPTAYLYLLLRERDAVVPTRGERYIIKREEEREEEEFRSCVIMTDLRRGSLVKKKLEVADTEAINEAYVPLIQKERPNRQVRNLKQASMKAKWNRRFVTRWNDLMKRHADSLESFGLDKYSPSKLDKYGLFVHLEASNDTKLSDLFEEASISCDEGREKMEDRYALKQGWNVSPGAQHAVAEARKQLQKRFEDLQKRIAVELEDGLGCAERNAAIAAERDKIKKDKDALLAFLEAMPWPRWSKEEEEQKPSSSDTTGQEQHTGTATASRNLSLEDIKKLEAVQKIRLKALLSITFEFDIMENYLGETYEILPEEPLPTALGSEPGPDAFGPAPMDTSGSEPEPAPAPSAGPSGAPSSSTSAAPGPDAFGPAPMDTSGSEPEPAPAPSAGPSGAPSSSTSAAPAPQPEFAKLWEKPGKSLDSLFGGDADASIYGELTTGSVRNILRVIQVDQGSQDNERTFLLDVGSGTMRVPIQAAFEMGWDAAGFDNSPNRVYLGAALCSMANQAAKKLVSDAPNANPWKCIGRIRTAMGDALCARNFNGVDVVYMFDHGFIESVMKQLGKCWNHSDKDVKYIVSTKTGVKRIDRITDDKGNRIFSNLKLIQSVNVSKRFSSEGNTANIFKRTDGEDDQSGEETSSVGGDQTSDEDEMSASIGTEDQGDQTSGEDEMSASIGTEDDSEDNDKPCPVNELVKAVSAASKSFEENKLHFDNVLAGTRAVLDEQKKTRKNRRSMKDKESATKAKTGAKPGKAQSKKTKAVEESRPRSKTQSKKESATKAKTGAKPGKAQSKKTVAVEESRPRSKTQSKAQSKKTKAVEESRPRRKPGKAQSKKTKSIEPRRKKAKRVEENEMQNSKILMLGMLTPAKTEKGDNKDNQDQADRDSLRIAKMKALSKCSTIYTVSLQAGHEVLHLNADFTDRRFPLKVMDQFLGKGSARFDQIILDFIWSPTSWTQTRWSRYFFASILARVSAEDVLTDDGSVLTFSNPSWLTKMNCVQSTTSHSC
jgi:hypothetical protein